MGTPRKSNQVRTSSPPPGQDDRRGSCRYTVVEDHAWLGWWDGPSFVTTPGQILDLSLRGASLQVQMIPPPGQSVWFCPPRSAVPEWVEARLIESNKKPAVAREVRIAFHRLLPYDTFKTLVYGTAATAIEAQPFCAEREYERKERERIGSLSVRSERGDGKL